MKRIFSVLLVALSLLGCTESVNSDTTARILVLGDSLMAANSNAGKGVANALEKELGEEVIDRSVIGARYFYILPVTGSAGMKIEKQFRAGPWDWIILNGGGNDILFGCGCGACTKQLTRLVSPDGKTGAIPTFVKDLRSTGAKVIYTGYLRTPGVTSPIEGCNSVGDEMDRRLAKMANQDKGVTFVPLSGIVPDGDTSYHGLDLIHPSHKGSAAIAALIASFIAP